MNDAAFRLENHGLVAAVMLLWAEKLNTAEIAERLHRPESEIAHMLRIGRELRRNNCAQ